MRSTAKSRLPCSQPLSWPKLWRLQMSMARKWLENETACCAVKGEVEMLQLTAMFAMVHVPHVVICWCRTLRHFFTCQHTVEIANRSRNWCSQRAPAQKASESPIDAVYKFEPSLDLFLKLWRYFSLPWPERGWSLGIGSLCSSREQGGRRFAWKVVKPTFHILEYGLTIKTSGTKSLVPPTPNQVGPCWMSPLMGTFPPNFIASPAS